MNKINDTFYEDDKIVTEYMANFYNQLYSQEIFAEK